MCRILTKGSGCHKKIIESFVDLNRAGHDKSFKKETSVLAQIFTKLRPIYEFVSVAVKTSKLQMLSQSIYLIFDVHHK